MAKKVKKVKFKPTKGIKKRFKITANKKLKYQHIGMRKLMSGTRGEHKQRLQKAGVVRHPAVVKVILELAGER